MSSTMPGVPPMLSRKSITSARVSARMVEADAAVSTHMSGSVKAASLRYPTPPPRSTLRRSVLTDTVSQYEPICEVSPWSSTSSHARSASPAAVFGLVVPDAFPVERERAPHRSLG